MFFHGIFDGVDVLRIGEDHQIASIDEIHLGGEEGRGRNPVVTLLVKQSERCREQRAADAVADGIDLLFAGRLSDRVQSETDTLTRVGFPTLGGMPLVRI